VLAIFVYLLICFCLVESCGGMALSCYASAKNKAPILELLQSKIDFYRLAKNKVLNILEIASGMNMNFI